MRIKSFDQLEAFIKECQEARFNNGNTYDLFYRGQSQSKYLLQNGISRFEYNSKELLERERKLFDEYSSLIIDGTYNYVGDHHNNWNFEFEKQWHYQYQGQHLGLKTRLMDWSINWRIGLFFALNEMDYWGRDGSLYVFECPKNMQINATNLADIYNFHPLEIENSYMINAPFFQENWEDDVLGERRRFRQFGRFFVQPSNKAFISPESQVHIKKHIYKLTLDGDAKKELYDNISHLTKDYVYYRTDDNIDNDLKVLNAKYF